MTNSINSRYPFSFNKCPNTILIVRLGRQFVVVDDFLYNLSPVTHPNDDNDWYFPPLISNASLLSLSHFRSCFIPLSIYLSRFPVSSFVGFLLSPILSLSKISLLVNQKLRRPCFLSLSLDMVSHFAPSHPHFPPFALLHFLSLTYILISVSFLSAARANLRFDNKNLKKPLSRHHCQILLLKYHFPLYIYFVMLQSNVLHI